MLIYCPHVPLHLNVKASHQLLVSTRPSHLCNNTVTKRSHVLLQQLSNTWWCGGKTWAGWTPCKAGRRRVRPRWPALSEPEGKDRQQIKQASRRRDSENTLSNASVSFTLSGLQTPSVMWPTTSCKFSSTPEARCHTGNRDTQSHRSILSRNEVRKVVSKHLACFNNRRHKYTMRVKTRKVI